MDAAAVFSREAQTKAQVKAQAQNLGDDIFSLESNTRAVGDVLAELGFDPFLFDSFSSRPIRVIPHTAQGCLTTAIHFSIRNLSEAFDLDSQDAWAIPTHLQKSKNENNAGYVIVRDPQEYDYHSDIAGLAHLPPDYVTHCCGDSHLMQGLTLAHEASHFELPQAGISDPVRVLNVELRCDIQAHLAFKDAADSQIFDITTREFKYARAIGALMPNLIVHLDYAGRGEQSTYNHATALFLHDPAVFDLDAPATSVIAAHKKACAMIAEGADPALKIPVYMRGYLAGKDILVTQHAENISAENDVVGDLAREIISLYVEGAEYFSPDLCQRALDIAEKQRLNSVLMPEFI